MTGRNQAIKTKRRKKISTKQQQRRERMGSIVRQVLLTALVISTFLAMGYLIRSPEYRIDSLAVDASDKVLAERISKKIKSEMKGARLFVPNNNRFLWTTSRVSKLVAQDFPGVEQFDLSIEGNELLISVEQYKPTAVWCPQPKLFARDVIANDCYGINDQGEVFLYNNSIEDFNLLQLTDIFSPPTIGQTVTSDIDLSQLIKLSAELKSREYSINYIVQTNDLYRLHLDNTTSAPIGIEQVVLPRHDDDTFDLAIKDLFLVIDQAELVTIATRENIAYYKLVDFTSPNKVFYQFVKNNE